jgi:uncharacterized damage-inducible protein DinB
MTPAVEVVRTANVPYRIHHDLINQEIWMNSNTYFRAQAYNNAMSNHRLLTACAQLNDNELAQERVSFFPSIIHTWNHILTVDWYYVSALEGSSMGPAAFDPEIPYPLFVDFEVAQRAVDQRLISLCEDLTDAQLAQTVSMIRPQRIQQDRADRTLLHWLSLNPKFGGTFSGTFDIR